MTPNTRPPASVGPYLIEGLLGSGGMGTVWLAQHGRLGHPVALKQVPVADDADARRRTPSNVLMAADGPRLIDFEIYRAVDGTRMTSTGMITGTPASTSPEQTEGNDIGPATDVFSLGVVLVMAATGVGPFGEGTPIVLLRRILTTERNLGALVELVRDVVAECLRLDVAQRPTAAQLVERLEPVPEPEPVAQPSTRKQTAVLPAEAVAPTRVAEPEPRSPVRRRAFLIGTGAVLAGLGITPLLLASRDRPALWTFNNALASAALRSWAGQVAAGSRRRSDAPYGSGESSAVTIVISTMADM
jgi:hypothetical protein